MEDRYHRLKLILCLLALVLVGGSLGFWWIEEGWSLLDAAYMTVITITTIGYGEVHPLSAGGRVFAMLVIAAGIGVAGLAASQIASFMVSRELDGSLRRRRVLGLIRLIHGHCVVCGLGMEAQAFCKSMRSVNRQFVALVDSDDAYDLALAAGYLCLNVGNDWAGCFAAAGVERATNVVVMQSTDRDTLATGLRIKEYLAVCGKKESSVSVFLCLRDPAVSDLCKSTGTVAPSSMPPSLSTFSVEMNMVRLVYQDYPMEVLNDGVTLGEEVHIVLPEMNDFGSAFSVYSGVLGHYRGGIKTHLHIVTSTDEQKVTSFLRQYTGFEKCGYLQVCQIDGQNDYVERVSSLLGSLPKNSAISVILPEGDELVSFKHAVSLVQRMQSHPGARILVWPVADSPITRQMVAFGGEGRIRLLPVLEQACGVEAVLLETLDARAKAIHAEWCAEEELRARKCEAEGKAYNRKPTHKPWHELTEKQKVANRLQADHINIKIRAAGLTQDTARSSEAWSSLSKPSMEALAEMEHERWCADKYMNGWQHSPNRDDTQKLHPDLIPYADLDESTKQYDRDTLLKLHKYI